MQERKWFILEPLFWGPLFVIVGAGLWGTETFFRVNLSTRFDSEVLVFHEHLFCILFTLPLIILPLRSTWRQIRQAPLSAWVYLVLSGTVGSALGTTFFTLALNAMNVSVANVLLNFQPIITVVFAKILLREKLGRRFFVWAALALICGAVIASSEFSLSDLHWSVGLVYITITALAWGFATVAGRGAMIHLPLRAATAGRFIVGGFAILVSLVFKGHFTPEYLKWGQLTDIFVVKNYLWLSVVAGVIPLYLYFKGLSKTSASVGGFCELTQTFTALLLTWGIMGQALTTKQVLAGVILLACVYMINLNFAKANQRALA